MKRNIGLDLLKTMACFAVIVLHVTGIIVTANNSNTYTINHTLYYIAVFAVPIFFMVNGYLLLNKSKMGYKYIIKKIISILIIIFSWNVLIFLASLVKHKVQNPFVNFAGSLIQKGYFWQFWFFGALIIVYLVLPIIYNYFKNLKIAIAITGIFVIISLSIDLLSLIRSIQGNSILQVHVIQTFRLWTWLAYYLLGGLLGKKEVTEYILKHMSMSINWIIFIISIIVISIYQFNISFLYKNPHAEFFYDNIFTFMYVISLFILVYRQDYSRYKNKIIELISKNAMGIYIIHVTILNALTHFYKFNTPITNIGLIFVVFVISLILSEVISRVPIVNKLVKL